MTLWECGIIACSIAGCVVGGYRENMLEDVNIQELDKKWVGR